MCTNKSFLNGKSKELAYLLRHDTTYDFPNDGYRDVKDLFENHDFTYPILEEIVRTDKKGRYEFNNDYREAFTSAGLTLSGTSPDGRLVETVELTERPFYVGVQYHPEFKSRPNKAHPLFKGFIKAAMEHMSEGK